jgi:acylphosphatase
VHEVVRRLEIRGLVQRAGYRRSMVRQAALLGVHGWVRNRADGSVEAMVAGSAQAVRRIVEWAAAGPPGAQVSSVDSFPGDGEYTRFEQWPTP